tara:strand:- start:617 stop:1216 length:600 start_codon:yes stop_codon:yes gene_type:complete
MKIKKEYLFPTVAYKVKDVLSKESFENIKQYIVDSYESNPMSNWQSESSLHEWDEFKDLTKSIIDMGKYIFDDLKFVYEDFEITEMWANVSKKGEGHKVHTHLNNIFTGVFYIESGANIRFLDPRPAANVLLPTMEEYNSENSNQCSFPSTENTMLLFPAWLQHYVPRNRNTDRRISISFNLMLKGMVGEKGNLQSAKF